MSKAQPSDLYQTLTKEVQELEEKASRERKEGHAEVNRKVDEKYGAEIRALKRILLRHQPSSQMHELSAHAPKPVEASKLTPRVAAGYKVVKEDTKGASAKRTAEERLIAVFRSGEVFGKKAAWKQVNESKSEGEQDLEVRTVENVMRAMRKSGVLMLVEARPGQVRGTSVRGPKFPDR